MIFFLIIVTIAGIIVSCKADKGNQKILEDLAIQNELLKKAIMEQELCRKHGIDPNK